MVAIVGVLLTGIVLMGIGGKANERYSHKLMVARVTLQGMVLALLMLLYATSKK